ncbi:MAG: hypothetical protein KGY70_11235 [Bacteroidales bacterium]|nr:hypothetical protein [Bacteroidales bacterium]
MKRTTAILTIFIFLIFSFGCHQKQMEKETFIEFPETRKLISKKTGAGAFYKYVGGIKIYDSLLILSTRRAEKKIQIYDKNTFEHIASAGVVGKGPGEIQQPWGASWDHKNKIIWYNDLTGRKIWEFKVDSILNHPGYKPTHFFKIPARPSFIKGSAPFKNDLFTYPTDLRENFLMVFNAQGKIVDSIPNKTNIYPDYDPMEIISRTWYHYHIASQKQKIIFAYNHADFIVCTDFEGNILFKRQGPDMIREETPKKMSFEKEAKINFKSTFNTIRSDNRYIYCLYNGRNNSYMEDEEIKHTAPKNLFIYTWEGSPVMRIKLDHPTSTFALDKENNRIITYPNDIGDLVYYNFDFDKLEEIY